MRRTQKVALKTAAFVASCIALSTTAFAVPAVWTEHNDSGRTGQNIAETTLTPANVNSTQFGQLFHYTVDDQVFAQPLYIPALTMSVDNLAHDVVFVATVNNSVYAFDADSNTVNGGNPLWHVSLTPSGARPVDHTDIGNLGACGGNYVDYRSHIGIVGTPVIDTSTGTLYVVARTIENGNTFVQRLHALDIKSGAEKLGGPVTITGTYSNVAFDPALNNQRPALALANGFVYIMWSSQCDFGQYHGFVMTYNASNLAHVATWASTTGAGTWAGIWQGGQGAAVDGSNNIYFMTGNGTWDGSSNFGESVMKLAGTSLTMQDYFTPNNYASLNGADEDLGSAGCMMIPGTTDVFGGGKQGMVYLMNSANMGHEAGTDRVVQEFQATFPSGGNTGHIHGGPVYLNTAGGQYVYLWGENDFMRTFQFNGTTFNSTSVANSSMRAPTSGNGMPGGFLSVSANGNTNGIVWATTAFSGDANHSTVPGIVHAFDAQTFTGGALRELWNSQQNATRDSYGNFAKFTYPTIANGKVYVPTFGTADSGSGSLYVYGLLNTTSTPPSTPSGLTASPGNTTITLNWTPSTGTAPITYSIYRGLTAGGESATAIATGVSNNSYTDSSLTNGTTYYYTVKAVNGVGTSTASNEAHAAPQVAIAAPPTSLAATGSDSQISLTWTASVSATSYNIYRGTSAGGEGATAVGTSSTTSFTNAGLTNGTTYFYTVKAVNSAGTSTASNEASATPSAALTDVVAIACGNSAVTPFAADKDFTGGNVSGGTTHAIDTSAVAGPAPMAVYQHGRIGSFTYTIPGLTAGTSYGVRLHFAEYAHTATGQRKFNASINGTQVLTNFDIFAAAGAEYKANVQSFMSTANASGQIVIAFTTVLDNSIVNGIEITTSGSGGIPSTPSNLAARPGNSSVSLTWTGATGATSYNIYRGTSAGGESPTAVGTSASTTFNNTGLTNGTKYYFTVKAVSATGTSAVSNEASATPTASVTPPSAPVLSGSAGNAQITLNWTASSGTSPISYAVYQGATSGGEGATPVASGIAGTSYTGTGYTNGTAYFFKVVASNSAGSATSNEISVTPSAGVAGIDLIVTSVTWTPTTLASGTHVVFTAVVKNQGSTATPAGTIVGCQFAMDGKSSPINWNDQNTASLAPGASVTLTATGGTNGVNYWPATSGSHTVQAWVDDVNRIAESNENNNKLTATFTVP